MGGDDARRARAHLCQTQFRNPAPLIAATAAAALALSGGAAIMPPSTEAQQTSASQSQTVLATPIRVHGIVVDSASGTPLAGAQVWTGPLARAVGTVTNARGEYELRITTEFPRPLRITAAYIGYANKTYEIEKPDSVIELKYSLAQQFVHNIEKGFVVTGLTRSMSESQRSARLARPPIVSRIIRHVRRILP